MEMVIPNELQMMFTLAMAGVMIMNLIYLSLIIPVRLIFRFRMSFASVIASLCMVWATKIFIFAPFLLAISQEALENRWITGFFMMIMLAIYCGFLFAFQPDSMHQTMIKNLKETELRKNTYLLDYNKKAWLQATKEKNTARANELDIEIAKIRDDRKAIKREFSKFKWIYRLFQRKAALPVTTSEE